MGKSGAERRAQNQRQCNYYKSLSHELRVRILHVLRDAATRRGTDFTGLSPTLLSGDLEERLGNVNYHIEVLEGHELIEEVGKRQVRGATEHFYAVREEICEWVDARLAEFS